MQNELYHACIDHVQTEIITSDKLENTHLTKMGDQPGEYMLRYNGINYPVTIDQFDTEKKECIIYVEGLQYQVLLKNPLDLLIQKMGLNSRRESSNQNIAAPMPGLVLELMVSEGDLVKKGDVLIVLEAMKMENVILAPKDGIVKIVHIKKSKTVEKGTLLLELE
jgi:biotin carboxyl carrier protein